MGECKLMDPIPRHSSGNDKVATDFSVGAVVVDGPVRKCVYLPISFSSSSFLMSLVLAPVISVST